jgi:hypothetical protein
MRQSVHPRAQRRHAIASTLTYEELQTIESLAKHVLAQEQMPDGLWRGSLRDLERRQSGAMKA